MNLRQIFNEVPFKVLADNPKWWTEANRLMGFEDDTLSIYDIYDYLSEHPCYCSSVIVKCASCYAQECNDAHNSILT